MGDDLTRDDVMAWVAQYERAWRDSDASAVPHLFSEDARYARSPYTPALLGHEEIREFWTADEGARFTMTAEPVAVESRAAVVRVGVQYTAPQAQEYKDLWVLEFADDGRVAEFEEWAYWPGLPYTASGPDAFGREQEPGPTPEI